MEIQLENKVVNLEAWGIQIETSAAIDRVNQEGIVFFPVKNKVLPSNHAICLSERRAPVMLICVCELVH